MPKKWWMPLALVIISGLAGVFFMGLRTYQDAPPIPNFADSDGKVIFSHDDVLDGQVIFQKYALMDYGSMFGDGAGRGPDFTADALHRVFLSMLNFYERQSDLGGPPSDRQSAIEARVKREIKSNSYDQSINSVRLTSGQAAAFEQLATHYRNYFGNGEAGLVEHINPSNYITNPDEIRKLTCFFYWGAWVCGAERPGKNYSYTHNWPYDPDAGNQPSSGVLLWSVFGCLALVAGVGWALYMRGRLDKMIGNSESDKNRPVLLLEDLDKFRPTNTQKATYKFFAVAAILFLIQVIAGVLTIHDFVLFTKFFGVDLAQLMPITVTRSWHLQLSLFWISTCWIGGSIFCLPWISSKEPKGQLALINALFAMLVIMVGGTLVGCLMGPKGLLEQWQLFGNQGWEFVELGKVWQVLLFACLGVWALIVYRGVKPSLENAHPIALPNWLFYSVLCVLVLFLSSFVAQPRTNFVIADFWRWCVIHMWVESFFEVFTTALIAYFMFLMGLVGFNSASRIVYLATLLFLGSGIIGISHNFYWNAKPVETLALGSVFSTLQVVPLILLTLEAWRFRCLPGELTRKSGRAGSFGQSEAFLFLLGVNFWNFVGAGVFGFIINLPIVNYYEHGTYLTVNHGHAALMGVYGNLAIAAMLFCSRYLIHPAKWSPRLLTCSFWSMNIGLVLMVAMDLFPAGILQLAAVLDNGLWFARSQQFVLSTPFQTFTWMRAVGGTIFVVGGVFPLVAFLVTRLGAIKEGTTDQGVGELIAREAVQEI